MSTQPHITICPPGQQDVHFDEYAFTKSVRAVSARYTPEGWDSTGLAFSDYMSGMHIQRIKGKRNAKMWIPKFANNNEQLRHVIAQAVWQHIHTHGPIPPGLIADRVILEQMCIVADKRRIAKAYTTRYGRKPGDLTDAMWVRHVGSVQLAGSYLTLLSTLAYRSWRLEQPSTTVAAQLGLTAVGVRQHLYRLVRTARKLGYPTHENHWSFGKEGIRTPHKLKLPPGPQLIKEVETDGYNAVAARYDVLRISVYKAYGIAKGPTGTRPPRKKIYTPELLAQVEQLRAEGLTYRTIAAKLNLNLTSLACTVYTNRKRAAQGAAALELV